MKKFFFYPCRRYEKVEMFLSRMEAEGYRLVSVKCGCRFRSQACKPKQERYFLPHSVLKYYGTDNDMIYNNLHAACGQPAIPLWLSNYRMHADASKGFRIRTTASMSSPSPSRTVTSPPNRMRTTAGVILPGKGMPRRVTPM